MRQAAAKLSSGSDDPTSLNSMAPWWDASKIVGTGQKLLHLGRPLRRTVRRARMSLRMAGSGLRALGPVLASGPGRYAPFSSSSKALLPMRRDALRKTQIHEATQARPRGTRLKVLHVNTYDFEGGAARATSRLMAALRARGVDSKILAARVSRKDPNVIGPTTPAAKGLAMARGPLDKIPLRGYPNRISGFSPNWVPDRIADRIESLAPDVVHIGWINGGFIRIESLPRIQRPAVMTMHDMWPFTGGCHYSGECTRYSHECGKCPILASERSKDLSTKVFRRKRRAWRDWDVALVAISHWLAEEARKSPIFQGREVKVIPWCLDLQAFSPIEKAQARALLDVPAEEDVILFGSIAATSDRNKGYDLVLEALEKLKEMGTPRPVRLLVFGSSGTDAAPNLPFPVRFLGHLNDDIALRVAYSAADVMTVPSRQEAFGQTTIEAMACGTPVVGFRATGMLDTVRHGETGYLATPYDPADLANGYLSILRAKEGQGDLPAYPILAANARASVEENFSPERVTGMYLEVFQAAIERHRERGGVRSH
jgi:glycosyltransferase involved in cell wall biosynthesis